MTEKKKDYEQTISEELGEMLEQNPGLEKEPLYKLGAVLDDMTDYLERINSEEEQLEPDDPNLDEMMAHFPLKMAAQKIEHYHEELKEILFILAKRKPH